MDFSRHRYVKPLPESALEKFINSNRNTLYPLALISESPHPYLCPTQSLTSFLCLWTQISLCANALGYDGGCMCEGLYIG